MGVSNFASWSNPAIEDSLADRSHFIIHVLEVVDGEQLVRDGLMGLDEVVKIGSGVIAAGEATAIRGRIQRASVRAPKEGRP